MFACSWDALGVLAALDADGRPSLMIPRVAKTSLAALRSPGKVLGSRTKLLFTQLRERVFSEVSMHEATQLTVSLP